MKLNFEVVVIGAGPAGMTAALYLKRANYNVLIIEAGAPGGQMNRALNVENYAGFPEVAGPVLAVNMYEQMQKLEVPYQYGEVVAIEVKGKVKIIKFKTGAELKCTKIILATGRKPKELGLKQEKKLLGRGVSYCVYCDGSFFKDKIITIVGNGDHILAEIDYLVKIAKKVNVIDYSEEGLILNKSSKIKSFRGYTISDLEATAKQLTKIKLSSPETGEIKELETAGLFINLGYQPNSELGDVLKLKRENDYIVVNKKLRTSRRGIYACGDVIKKDLYQIATAVGEGATAAYYVMQELKDM